MLITFEGGEGSGKSTQIKLLAEKLEQSGYDVTVTREPGGSAGAEAVRHVLLSGAAEALGPEMEALLFAASRADHVDTVIKPALEAGRIVLSDRFIDSTRVYQGITGDVDPRLIRRLEILACNGVFPELTLIIDIDPETGLERAAERRAKDETADRFEKDNLEKQEMRRQGFLSIAKAEPDRCKIIDGNGTPLEIHKRIWKAVQAKMSDMAKPKTKERVSSGKQRATPSRSASQRKTSRERVSGQPGSRRP